MALARVSNPPNPWLSTDVEWLGPPPEARLEVYIDRSRNILARNDSPDIDFQWSVNPYRGCFHGCAYCYARSTHQYLGFGAGTDFERKIVVKPNAPVLLQAAFERRQWRGEVVAFSGVTDCYQPLEASFRITRACLQVCLAYRNPIGIVTKSPLIERDIDLLVALHREAYVAICISVPFFDPDHARALEPYVPPPRRRFETIRRLAQAGVPVGVNVAPIIPGLTDAQMVRILGAARHAGAQWASLTMVRLPGPVEVVFLERLYAYLPARASRVVHRIEEMRHGRRNDPRFELRMRGTGNYAHTVHRLFEQTRRRLGFGAPPPVPDPSPFRTPVAQVAQLKLF